MTDQSVASAPVVDVSMDSVANVEPSEQVFHSRYRPAPDLIEDMEMYTQGGLHPVHLQDSFQDRYTVIHKLGAGGSSTVWLAYDALDKRYVAIKIVSSCASKVAEAEAATHKKLLACLEGDALKHFLVPLLDDFWIDGPNGRHFCLVQGICGPSLISFRQSRTMKIRADLVSTLGKQIVCGLSQLHKADLVYGDLSAGNVAFTLDNLDQYSVEEVLKMLGQPKEYPVQAARGTDSEWVKQHGPSLVYDSIDFTHKSRLHLLKPEIKLIDLGSSYFSPKLNEHEGRAFTESYADASCLYFGEDTTRESDIWALACILFEMRSATCLFEDQSAGVFSEVLDRIGPLPKSWATEEEQEVGANDPVTDINDAQQEDASVQQQSKHESLLVAVNNFSGVQKLKQVCKQIVSWLSNHSLRLARTTTTTQGFEWLGKDLTLHGQITNIGNWHPWHKLTIKQRRQRLERLNASFAAGYKYKIDTSDKALDRGPPPPAALSSDEATDFEDLLRRMLTWDRAERLTIDQVAAHRWFTKTYVESQQGGWLQYFYRGAGYAKNGFDYI